MDKISTGIYPANWVQDQFETIIALLYFDIILTAMLTTTLRKVGGSIMMVVPPAVLDMLHLHAGATVALAVEGERLIIESSVKPNYTLDELVAQCDLSAPLSDEDRSWANLPSVGREL